MPQRSRGTSHERRSLLEPGRVEERTAPLALRSGCSFFDPARPGRFHAPVRLGRGRRRRIPEQTCMGAEAEHPGRAGCGSLGDRRATRSRRARTQAPIAEGRDRTSGFFSGDRSTLLAAADAGASWGGALAVRKRPALLPRVERESARPFFFLARRTLVCKTVHKPRRSADATRCDARQQNTQNLLPGSP